MFSFFLPSTMMIVICDLPKRRGKLERRKRTRICVDRGGGSSSATWTFADLINIIFRFKKIKNFAHSPPQLSPRFLACLSRRFHGTWTKSNIEEMAKKNLLRENVPPMLVTTDALKRLNYLATATARLRFSSVSRRRCCSTAWEAFAWNYFSFMD